MALVAWYKLNGNVLDSTVNGNHGTIVGSPTVVSDGPFGSCYNFNPDTNDRISISNLSQFIYNTPLSISAWVKTPGLGTGQTVNGIVSLTYGSRFFSDSTGILYVAFPASPSYCTLASNGININDNSWHHVCCTYNGDQMKIYIDGILNNSSVTGIIQTNTYTNNGAIGLDVNDSSKYKFNGSISDVRIYDEALSLKEVKELSKAKVLHYDYNQFQEPTTNVVTNTNLDTGWNKSYCTGILWNDISPPEGINSPVVSFYDADTDKAGYWFCYENYTPQIPGTIYTVSLYIKTRDSNFRIRHYTADNSETGRCYGEFITVPNDGKWHRIVWNSFTNPVDSQSDSLSFQFSFGSSQGEDQRTWLCAPQMEAKDHATPFVNGTRTAQVYDKSGYDNNAELAVSTTPTYVNESIVNKGCYEFDGTQYMTPDSSIMDILIKNSFTISFWLYCNDITGIIADVFGGGNYGHAQGGVAFSRYTSDYWYCDMYLVTSGRKTMTVSSSVIPVNQWNHITIIRDRNNLCNKLYVNESLKSTLYSVPGEDIYWNKTSYPFKIGKGYYTGTQGKLADFRIYSTALSEDDIKEIYQTRASIDKNGNLYCNNTEENKYITPLVDYTSWVVGSQGAQGTVTSGDFTNYFGLNGEQACNSIIESTDPWGNLVPIWQTLGNDVDSNDDGGFNTGTFYIDNTKLYRFSCWINRKVLGNGYAHFGTNGYGSVNGLYTLAGVNDTNAYFSAPLFTSLPIDEWLLMIGYIYPYTYTGTTNYPDSGYYNLDGNKVYSSVTSFKWRPETTSAQMRAYLFYSTDPTTHQQWCYPRVDICDGTEPTIIDLLNGIDYKHYQITKDLISSKGINKNSSILSNEFSEVGITEGLVAYYPLNGDAKDYSGNNNHGTVYGAIKAGGINNKNCLSFDSIDDYLEVIHNEDINFSNNSFSISVWIHPLVGNSYYIINKGFNAWTGHGSVTSKVYSLEGGDASGLYKPYFHLIDGVNHYVNPWYSDSKCLQYGQWHHLVAICDRVKKLLSLYSNGLLLSSVDISNLGDISNTYPMRIATEYRWGATPLNWFNGKIQDVRIYNRALSDKEIGILYNIFNPNINKTLQINKENIIYTKGSIKEV